MLTLSGAPVCPKAHPLGGSGRRPVQIPDEHVTDVVDGQQQVARRRGHQPYRIAPVG